jgi:DHA1 family tetracycline resistance protein-like MFS transporter
LVIFLTILVNLIGFGIIIPLLPFYGQALGASPIVIGLLFAAFSLAQLIAAPVLGDLSDRWGRRPVLLFSLLGTAVSFVLLALARSVAVLFLARIVDGLSGGNISTARAYIGDVTREEDRARGFGLIGAAFGLGFILGPSLAAVLSRLDYTAPAWTAGGLALAAAALAWRWLPETVHRVQAGRSSPWRAMPHLLRRPRLRVLLALDLMFWAAQAVYQTTFALFGARRFGFDVPQTGTVLAAVSVLGVVIQLGLVGPVVRRFGEGRTLAGGLLLAGGGLALASLAHRVALFIVGLIPAGVGIALAIPALTSLLSRSAGAEEQGRVQGVASSLESLGRTIGPLWGNGALQVVGEGRAFGSGAAVMAALGVLAWISQGARPAAARAGR